MLILLAFAIDLWLGYPSFSYALTVPLGTALILMAEEEGVKVAATTYGFLDSKGMTLC